MEPENQQLEKEKHLPKASFLGSMLVSWSVYTLFLAAKKKTRALFGARAYCHDEPIHIVLFLCQFPFYSFIMTPESIRSTQTTMACTRSHDITN